MKKSFKKVFFFSLLFCIFFLIPSNALASGNTIYEKIAKNVKEDIYVYDLGNLIEQKVEQQINTYVKEVKEKTTAEIFVVSVDTLENENIERYGYDLFNTIGIGTKEKDNGLLLLIAKEEEKVRIVIGRGFEENITAAKAGRILDFYFVPYREKGNISEGTFLTTKALISEISKKYETEFSYQEELVEDKEISPETIVLIIVIILILVILDFFFTGGRVTLFVLEVVSNSSSSGKSGGTRNGGGSTRGSGATR